MNIKAILDEIANEPGSNAKMNILRKYDSNELLKKVLYAAKSPRVKYYIKKLPDFKQSAFVGDLESSIDGGLSQLSNRDVTGHAGIEHLKSILGTSSPDDAYVIQRIIEKDLKIGMGTSNINKIFPKLIEKTPYMGAKAFSEKLAKDIFTPTNTQTKGTETRTMAYSQIKMDGRYCNAIIEDGEAYLESRSGETTLLTGSKLMDDLSKFGDCVLNGELTIPGFDRNTANGIVNSVIGITTKLRDGIDVSDEMSHLFERYNRTYNELLNLIVYTVWDRIELEYYDANKSLVPYSKRLHELMIEIIANQDTDMNVDIVEHKIVTSYSEAMEHFVDALNRGLEGTILKSIDGIWKDGKPNWQIKMKKVDYYDLKIVSFNYGTPGSKNELLISSIDVECEDGLLKTSPAGISDVDMKYITNNQDKLMGTIVEVKCSGISHDSKGNYSLLHPVFIKLRNDKHTANTFNECIAIDNMVNSLKVK